jgi:hypothetical protein
VLELRTINTIELDGERCEGGVFVQLGLVGEEEEVGGEGEVLKRLERVGEDGVKRL